MTTASQQSVYAPIAADLDRVVDAIAQLTFEEIASSPSGFNAHEILDERLSHVMAVPGKKMRPAITLLASKLWGATPGDTVINMAVAVELLHIAALIHDDTVDAAELRRGKSTAGFLWGNHFAVLLGDYVFATSARYVCKTGSVRVIERFAETICELSRGELHEMLGVWSLPVTKDEYVARIYDKTASLFSTSAESGAVLGSADETGINDLRNYGYYLGLAYQIRDDVLDYESTTDELGKPANQDLLSGKLTLPAIYAAEDSNCAATIKEFFDAPEDEREARLGEVLDAIRSAGGVERAENQVSEYLDCALRHIENTPPSACRDSLVSIIAGVNSI